MTGEFFAARSPNPYKPLEAGNSGRFDLDVKFCKNRNFP